MLRTHYTSEITEKEVGKEITVAGWVKKIRDLGKLKFIMLRDGKGIIQVTVKEAEQEIENTVNQLGSEWVISVHGKVEKNESAPGGFEIIPSSIQILNPSASPLPLDITGHVESDLDTRLNHRYLDLRRPEVASIFKIKSVIQNSFLTFFKENGFITINPPSIVAAATESGANLFPISYFEKEAFLAQSPQLYKQMLLATGLDKVVMITPAFRAEEHDTTRHLNEVMQMDIELAFVQDEEDALKPLEQVVNRIHKDVKEKCGKELELLGIDLKVPEIPFKRLSYDEALVELRKGGIDIKWGEDLTPEAERYLCSKFDPVIIKKWPTEIRAFYSMPDPENPKVCRSYDLLYGGIEILSGAQRIHKLDDLLDQFNKRGMNPESFEFYTNAFRYGMPPHAGWSIGLERITTIITGKKNIREASLYPRTRTRLVP